MPVKCATTIPNALTFALEDTIVSGPGCTFRLVGDVVGVVTSPNASGNRAAKSGDPARRHGIRGVSMTAAAAMLSRCSMDAASHITIYAWLSRWNDATSSQMAWRRR